MSRLIWLGGVLCVACASGVAPRPTAAPRASAVERPRAKSSTSADGPAAPPPAGLSPAQALPGSRSVRLPSGNVAAVIELPGSAMVAIDWRAPFGSADDGPLRGASHWVGSCLSLRTRAAHPLGQALAALGARADVQSEVETLRLRVHAPARHAAAALSLSAQLAQPPSLGELHAARPFAREAAGALLDAPEHTARAALLRELFELPTDRHPYADLLPNAAALTAASVPDVRKRAAALLDPKKAILTIAGGVTAQALGAASDALPQIAGRRSVPSPLPSAAPRVVVVDHPGAAVATALVGCLGPNGADPRSALARAAWQIFEGVAGRSASFRGQRFRFGPQVLAWSVTDTTEAATAWADAWLTPTRPDPDAKATQRSAGTRASKGAWLAARARASDAALFELESAAGVADAYGELLQLGLSPESFDEARRLARDAPTRALEAALATHLAPAGWVVVVAGDSQRIAPVLQHHAPVTVVRPKSDFSVLKRLPRTSAQGL